MQIIIMQNLFSLQKEAYQIPNLKYQKKNNILLGIVCVFCRLQISEAHMVVLFLIL